MRTLTQIKWIVLLVCFASQAQQQKVINNLQSIGVKSTSIYCITENPNVFGNNEHTKLLIVAPLVTVSSLNFITESGQMTYKEMELLPNAGVTRFVKIEFAGKQIKGFKDFYTNTIA